MALELRQLTSDEIITIERLAQSRMSSSKLRSRARIIWFASRGLRLTEVANHLSVSPKTVRQWVKQFNERGLSVLAAESANCACGTMMPTASRFCRSCGQPFQGTGEPAPAQVDDDPLPALYHEPSPPAAGTSQLDSQFVESREDPSPRRIYRRAMFVVLSVMLVAVLGLPLYLWSRSSHGAKVVVEQPATARSYFGVMNFKDVDGGGVYIDAIFPPGSPADEAGLIGGDVITSYDSQTVRDVNSLKEMVAGTPIGKTVQIVYMRDGETRATKLKTTSKNEIDRLDNLYDERPEGKGFMGEGNDLERVFIPNLNIYGVRLKAIRPKLPADAAGLLNGDIVIEFNGIPIRTHKELEFRVESAKPDTVAKLVILRGTQRLEVPVALGHNY